MELLECITVIRYLGIVQIIQPYIRTSVVTLEQSLDIKTLVGSGQSNTELSHRGIAVFVGVCFLIKVTDFTVTIQVFEDNVTRCVVGISLIGCIVELIPAYNENCSEIIFSITYGGPSLGQGESLLRDFGTRTTGNAQCWIMPTVRLANRYQSTVTGDFCDELILSKDAALPNGARNRASYENRDWRMKSTIMWDGESYKKITTDGLTMGDEYTWMFGERNEANGFINNDASNQTGYIFRKWIRQEAGWERTDGPQDFYLMRLADVYLMYAEAVNETSGPTSECVALLNKIRSRGNLPALTPDKYANSEAFFNAIEQERIVELATEGMRPFDIRRWRKIHDIWGEANSDGLTLYDTNGTRIRDEFKNAPELNFQKNYIYQIPENERNRNPNLTQNTPWR